MECSQLSFFLAGYFVYDFLDLLVSNNIFKMWEVTLHHIAVCITFDTFNFIHLFILFKLIITLVQNVALHARS